MIHFKNRQRGRGTAAALAVVVACFAFAGQLSSASAAETRPEECRGRGAIDITSLKVNGKEIGNHREPNGDVSKTSIGENRIVPGDTVSVTFKSRAECFEYYQGSYDRNVHFYAFETELPYFTESMDQRNVVNATVDYKQAVNGATLTINVPKCNFQIDVIPGGYTNGTDLAMWANGGRTAANPMGVTCPSFAPTTTAAPTTVPPTTAPPTTAAPTTAPATTVPPTTAPPTSAPTTVPTTVAPTTVPQTSTPPISTPLVGSASAEAVCKPEPAVKITVANAGLGARFNVYVDGVEVSGSPLSLAQGSKTFVVPTGSKASVAVRVDANQGFGFRKDLTVVMNCVSVENTTTSSTPVPCTCIIPTTAVQATTSSTSTVAQVSSSTTKAPVVVAGVTVTSAAPVQVLSETVSREELAATGVNVRSYMALGFLLMGIGGLFALAMRHVRITA